MLIRLLKNWTLYPAGQVVDVYSGVGKDLIDKGIGYDVEKPLPTPKVEAGKEKAEKTLKTAVEESEEDKYTSGSEKSILEAKTLTQQGSFRKINE